MHGLPGKKVLIQNGVRKLLFVYGLYKDADSSSGYLVSSVRTVSEC